MNPATLKALKQSIAHWERMRMMKWEERGCSFPRDVPDSEHCALCRRFLNATERKSCTRVTEDCPVAQKSGKVGCQCTPFSTANSLFWLPGEAAWRKGAKAEIDFLKSLLPKQP